MDTDYVMNEMKRGRGTQFDPEALDAFLRLVDKGLINLEEIYAQKKAEIHHADQEAELARRVEEDKRIQAEAMGTDLKSHPVDDPEENSKDDDPVDEKGAKV